ncbi:MAG: Fe2+ transport system protein FeoA [Candidatus Midichloriaceae bacterium]|jgi:Fe2+ transport system protein FeoA
MNLTKLKKGKFFFISKYALNGAEIFKMMELGILPKIKMYIMQRNLFGSFIIKCNGNKYALDTNLAKKLTVSSIAD